MTRNALYVITSGKSGTPRDTLYPWGKGINKQKTSIFAFSVKWLVKSAVYDAQRTLCHCEASPIMGTPKDTLYFWGKGVCKHKTGDCRLRQSTGQKRSIRRAEGNHIIKPTQDTSVLAWRKKAQTSIRVSIAAPTMRFQQRSLRRLPCMNFGKC